MKRLPNDIDIHRHARHPQPGAVVNIDPTECLALPPGQGLFSVGIHPWNAALANDTVWERMNHMLRDSRVVAVGEAGLDNLRGPAMPVQAEVFRRQAQMAHELDLPLILHCVRCADGILAVRKELKPRNQWIWHGFRGGEQMARQLLCAGIDLSYGRKFNDKAFLTTPPERRYRETDLPQ